MFANYYHSTTVPLKWTNRILKEYVIKGYAVNDRIRKEQIGELRQLVGMLGRTIQNQPLISTDETNALPFQL